LPELIKYIIINKGDRICRCMEKKEKNMKKNG
jgi:hypothetical protein